MSYEKDRLDSLVTSASLTTALAPYATSQSVSAAIAVAIGAIDLSAYVSSNSLSVAVATDALTVRGAAAVSATLSAGAVTVAGRPVGAVLIGYQNLSGLRDIAFSGSWSDFPMLQLHAAYSPMGTGGTPSTSIFTDGGTSAILSLPNIAATFTFSSMISLDVKIYGVNGQGGKFINAIVNRAVGVTTENTATANTGFVNCFRFNMSTSATRGFAALYGWRQT